jgi:hypothetical protein
MNLMIYSLLINLIAIVSAPINYQDLVYSAASFILLRFILAIQLLLTYQMSIFGSFYSAGSCFESS